MSAPRLSPPVLRAALVALVLHTVTVLWCWRTWGEFGRYLVLDWIDFPVALLYWHVSGGDFLATSLVLGGLQWALIGALLAFILGRTLRRRRA